MKAYRRVAAIARAIRGIVLTGKLRKLETLRGRAAPEVASLADYPRLDPKRVLRVYKKLGSIESLREKLESGEIESMLGLRMEQHIRQGLSETHAMLLYRADDLRDAVEEFLLTKCAVKAVQVVGACRRRVEVIEEIAFVIGTDAFPAAVRRMQRYGGLLRQCGLRSCRRHYSAAPALLRAGRSPDRRQY